ncbi:hypothetical protein FDI69_gp013 [Rhodococcus phage Trina]|uniref:Uncharacterized protein n=1 Tax=Rhodococcus phage Trina TaxID=2027905 RepID=A0A2D0ZMV8_9CAUD|nr:hypothetical protein FDI69_gp013 [Rhodococcus phage Trina]ASZ74831.1 hypothetical protein SEA_TRINA_13 [Rhodococcus phage Trina]
MIIGFDYWQVLSHYPDEISTLEAALFQDHETHFISAVGNSRRGSVTAEVLKIIPEFDPENVHEVVFKHARESPELKLAKCKELGITMFFDDRTDVVDLLNQNGVLAFRVPRKKRGQSDIDAERK